MNNPFKRKPDDDPQALLKTPGTFWYDLMQVVQQRMTGTGLITVLYPATLMVTAWKELGTDVPDMQLFARCCLYRNDLMPHYLAPAGYLRDAFVSDAATKIVDLLTQADTRPISFGPAQLVRAALYAPLDSEPIHSYVLPGIRYLSYDDEQSEVLVHLDGSDDKLIKQCQQYIDEAANLEYLLADISFDEVN
jgi:hypothetical protein